MSLAQFGSSSSGARTVAWSMAWLRAVHYLVPSWWLRRAARRSAAASLIAGRRLRCRSSRIPGRSRWPRFNFVFLSFGQRDKLHHHVFVSRPHIPASSLTSRPPVFRRASGTCVFRHSSANAWVTRFSITRLRGLPCGQPQRRCLKSRKHLKKRCRELPFRVTASACAGPAPLPTAVTELG